MKIAYLLESTCLCGGVKVVFNHVAALVERGHDAVVIAREPWPTWIDKRVPFLHAGYNGFDTESLSDRDIILGTDPLQLLSVYAWVKTSGWKGTLVHFCQGYEGAFPEGEPYLEKIFQAYSLPIPKITLSENLSARLRKNYPTSSFFTCGQGLERDFFYPSSARYDSVDNVNSLKSVFLFGSLNFSVKCVDVGLRAFRIAAARRPDLRLIRVSTAETLDRELLLVDNIHEYHVNLRPESVGELFRSHGGVLLAPSAPSEGFGLPALEAMACGLPVILTDIPSYRSFGEEGMPCDYAVFVPANDSEAMANALLSIVENRIMRNRLVTRGLSVVKKYSYAEVAARMEVLLRCFMQK